MKYTEVTKEYVDKIFLQEKGYKTVIECEECDGVMVVRYGTNKFLGCSNYPKCTCKMGNGNVQYRGDIKGVNDSAFSDSSGLKRKNGEWTGESNWYNDISEMYPSGIRCKDDM